MSDDITYDPHYGMVMLPPGTKTVPASSWGDSDPNLAEYLTLERGAQGDRLGTDWVDVVVALIPRPDNDHNTQAISVAQPGTYGGDLDRRHIGYVYDDDHPRLGGRTFHRIARRLGSIDLGCYARIRRGARRHDIELYLPQHKELRALVESYLSRLENLPPQQLDEQRQHAATVRASLGPLAVPPARVDQAELLDDHLDLNQADQPTLTVNDDAALGTVKVQQQSVFGNRNVCVTNHAGGRYGEVRDGTLFLTDERLRRAALHALHEARIDVAPPTAATGLNHPYPAGALTHSRESWAIEVSGTTWPVGNYAPSDGTLTTHTIRHLDLVLALLGRAGRTPTQTRWAPLDPGTYLTVVHGKEPVRSPRKVSFHDQKGTLVEDQVWRMLARHRSVFPDALADSSPLRWTTAPVNSTFRTGDTQWLHHDAYYRRDLEALFGPCDTGNWSRGQKPARCRLCDSDALTATIPVGHGTLTVAYCSSCARKASHGVLIDTGTDQLWHKLAIWSLQQLAAELGGLPSQAQLTRVTPTLDPDAADRALLVRMHVPRAPTKRSRGGTGQERAPYTWLDWLAAADLLSDGVRTARGTASVARDGHLCRSLLERHIDDFFTAAGIPHDVEPHWPYDPELNTTGLRADWLLPNGTFVEAWGLPGEAHYAAKMVRKTELAARTGIRLVGVTPDDLGHLPDLFADWVSDKADPAALKTAAEQVRQRAARPTRRQPASAAGITANTDSRTERLQRCVRATALQREGLSRNDIAGELFVAPETVKLLLRDGKFYADPDTDPVRRDLAARAHQAQNTGLTKARFRQDEGLSAPKAHEAWKDADVLFS